MGEAAAATEPGTDIIDIDTVAKRCNDLHEGARTSAVDAVKKAVELGNILIEVKESLKHGQWGEWCTTNLQFSERKARAGA